MTLRPQVTLNEKEQGWLHNFQSSMQNENAGPLVQKTGKNATKVTKIKTFFLFSVFLSSEYFLGDYTHPRMPEGPFLWLGTCTWPIHWLSDCPSCKLSAWGSEIEPVISSSHGSAVQPMADRSHLLKRTHLVPASRVDKKLSPAGKCSWGCLPRAGTIAAIPYSKTPWGICTWPQWLPCGGREAEQCPGHQRTGECVTDGEVGRQCEAEKHFSWVSKTLAHAPLSHWT